MKDDMLVAAFLETIQNEFSGVLKAVDERAVRHAADLILAANLQGNRVHVTGIGKPGHVAGYLASLLSSTGTPAYFLDGTEAVHGSSGQVMAGDVVIAISNSGETKELKATVNTLRHNGAVIISCTANPASWLAINSACCLVAAVGREGDSLNKPPRASILAEIVVLQALSVVLQEKKAITMESYGKWHPGGSIGQSIGLDPNEEIKNHE